MNGYEPSCCPATKRGSILILVLWVIFLLALLAVAVGAHVDSRLTLARTMNDRTAGLFAARSGLAEAIVLLERDTNGWDAAGEAWAGGDTGAFSNHPAGSGVYSLSYVVDTADGGHGTRYGVWDEQSRVDVNLAKPELVAALLEDPGGMEPERAAQVAAAIRLAVTRRPANTPDLTSKTGWISPKFIPGPLRSIEELRWIKGMTPSALSNMAESVTVHGGNRVNLNTAGAVVLRAVGKASGRGTGRSIESLTRKILQFRERGGIFKSLGLGDALGPDARLTAEEQSLLSGMAPYVTVASHHFRGHVEGAPAGVSAGSRRIDFVWDRNHHRIEFWHED